MDYANLSLFSIIMIILQVLLSPSLAILLIFFISWPTLKKFIQSKTTNVDLQNDIAEKQNKKSTLNSKLQNTACAAIGDVCSLKGSYDEAIIYYLQAVKNDPENASAYIGLGNAYSKKGQFIEAIDALEKAVYIKPYWADARCSLGTAYSLAQNHEKAIDEFIQAININPNYASAHYGLGKAYVLACKTEKASEQVYILKELDSTSSQKLAKMIEESQKTIQ